MSPKENAVDFERIAPSQQARVTKRRIGVLQCEAWGFDCPHGFAGFSEDDKGREMAERCAKHYNAGERVWSFWPISETTLIQAL